MDRKYPVLAFVAKTRARMGHTPSMVILGELREAEGGPESIELANRHYLQAAELGDAEAMWLYAVNHLGTKKGSSREPDIAVQWLKRASDAGHGMAGWVLGKLYLTGRFVEKDVTRAMALLHKSADSGHGAAARDLARIYSEGRHGVPANPAKAGHYELLA